MSEKIYFLLFYIFFHQRNVLGVPHLASETEISIVRGTAMEARIMMFVVQGERPNLTKTMETLATITGGRITVLDTRPYMSDNKTSDPVPAEGKRLIETHKISVLHFKKKMYIKKIFMIFCELFFFNRL